MALCVSTRLWLGAVVSPRRDKKATRRLAQMVRRCAQMGPILVVCDGFRHYREAFGRAIGANQGIAFQIADLDVATETARLLTYKAAALKDSGEPIKMAAARAKLYATEAAVSATRTLTQVLGGYGFIGARDRIESRGDRFGRDDRIAIGCRQCAKRRTIYWIAYKNRTSRSTASTLWSEWRSACTGDRHTQTFGGFSIGL